MFSKLFLPKFDNSVGLTFIQLGQLLTRNESLPVKDRFPPSSFILDQNFFDAQLRQAESGINEECAALEQEAAEHQKAVQAILSTFWLEMDEPSRSISVKHTSFEWHIVNYNFI